MRRLPVTLIVLGGALATAGSAVALVCHPDPPGTKTLAIKGTLEGYVARGWRVNIAYFDGACHRRATWDTRGSAPPRTLCDREFSPPSSTRAESPEYVAVISGDRRVSIYTWDGNLIRTISIPGELPIGRIAFWRRHLVVVTRGAESADRPARLRVYDVGPGRKISDWPLPLEADTLDVSNGIALFSAADHQGLYAMRLRDGRFALVGLNHLDDMPQIEPSGIVFADDLYKNQRRSDRALLKFIPLRAVARGISRTIRPVEIGRHVGPFTVDGPRVAFVMKDPHGSCDSVGFWSIPWHYVTNAAMEEEDECDSRERSAITAVAMGGMRLAWRTVEAKRQTVSASTVIRCVERIVARSSTRRATTIGPLAADGTTLVFSINSKRGGSRLAFVDGQQRVQGVEPSGAARQLVVDSGTVAAVTRNGIELRGHTIPRRTLRVAGVRAIALRGNTLAVLRRHLLDVYSPESGRLVKRWRVPSRLRPEVDVHYGIAVLTGGRRVFALKLMSGRIARLATAPGATSAQIEATGVVYRYNVRGHGFMAYVPFASVERVFR
jgi:hypothetical protein